MNKLLFILLICLSYKVLGQSSEAEKDSIIRYTRIDYLQMLDRLGIQESELRPGPSWDPNAPNAANSNEDKVNAYYLPDPFTNYWAKTIWELKNSPDWAKHLRKVI